MKNILLSFYLLLLLAGCTAAAEQRPTRTPRPTQINSPSPVIIPTQSPFPTPEVTPSPEPTAQPETPTLAATAPITAGLETYCGNKYWPVVLGATWVYTGTFTGSADVGGSVVPRPITETWQITQIDGDYPYPARFTVLIKDSEHQYFCDATGIYWVNDDGSRTMMLPPENLLIPEQTAYMESFYSVYVVDFMDVQTPMGVINGLELEYISAESNALYTYAADIGILRYETWLMAYRGLTLVSYSIPGMNGP
jgi:hypothetical protein